ncbi:MAG: hypothetical protein EBT86_07580 [Actinobacteria bacterium]|nr:hypothetical protein [Actinomycetota bacterium]
MVLAFLTFFTGIAISTIAIYYSVLGLASIFSAAALSVIIMGTVLEISKLVTAWWLKANWYRTPWSLKGYLTIAVITLMLITSMGIFGYLSKAHSDQSLVGGDVQAKLSLIDEKIKIARENIESNRAQLKQMDAAVDQVMSRSTTEQGADRSNQIRRSQAKDRERIFKEIEAEQRKITALNEEAVPIRAEVRKVEAEVGPIKYIAALIYGDNPDTNLLEKAVVWVILTIVFVFDPLAVLLLLASQMSFQWAFAERKGDTSILAKIKEEMRPKGPEETPKEEPKYEPDDGPLTDNQIQQIQETAPKPVEPIVKQTYLETPGYFFKWKPMKVEPVKEEPKPEPEIVSTPYQVPEPAPTTPVPIVVENVIQEPIVEEPKPQIIIEPIVEETITTDNTDVKINQTNELSPVPITSQIEPPRVDDLEIEKKK